MNLIEKEEEEEVEEESIIDLEKRISEKENKGKKK